jgi:hypothetical protein
MDSEHVIILLALAITFAPVFVAAFSDKPGGGIWKFLALCCCLLALYLGLTIAGSVAWLVAWACAAAVLSSIRRRSTDEEMLRAVHEQNELLRKASRTDH